MVELNKDTFSKLLNFELDFADFSLESVTNMAQKYPYFQSAQLIRAFLLKTTQEDYFEVALPTIATKVRDRALLYDMVYKPKTHLKINTTKDNVLKVEELVAVIEDTDNSILIDNTDILENQHNSDVPDENIEDEIDFVDNDLSVEEKIIEKVEIETNTEINPETDLSFADWLKHKANNSKNETSNYDTIPIQQISPVEVELMKESAQTMNHLDRFIVEEIVKKQYKKKDIVQNKNKNKSSDLSLVSETLAEIFVAQKKYIEAIETYQKLILKFPQKSSYFANRIEKINKYE